MDELPEPYDSISLNYSGRVTVEEGGGRGQTSFFYVTAIGLKVRTEFFWPVGPFLGRADGRGRIWLCRCCVMKCSKINSH